MSEVFALQTGDGKADFFTGAGFMTIGLFSDREKAQEYFKFIAPILQGELQAVRYEDNYSYYQNEEAIAKYRIRSYVIDELYKRDIK